MIMGDIPIEAILLAFQIILFPVIRFLILKNQEDLLDKVNKNIYQEKEKSDVTIRKIQRRLSELEDTNRVKLEIANIKHANFVKKLKSANPQLPIDNDDLHLF